MGVIGDYALILAHRAVDDTDTVGIIESNIGKTCADLCLDDLCCRTVIAHLIILTDTQHSLHSEREHRLHALAVLLGGLA